MEIKFKGEIGKFKEGISNLIKEFNVVFAPVPTPVAPATPATPVAKFGEATTKDNTVIKWEGDAPLAVGTHVMVIDPTNPNGFLPMPDGEVELMDGTKLTVKEGKVEVLTPIAQAPATPAMPDMTAQVAQMKAEIETVKENFSKEKSELETKHNAEIENMKKQMDAVTKIVKEGFEMFASALDVPTAEPVTTPTKVTKGFFD